MFQKFVAVMEEANLDALCDLLNDDEEEDLPVEPYPAKDNQVNLT